MAGNNLLIIMSDEHTRSVMGAYGNRLVQTPALDHLAANGVPFDNAYTPSPICISARTSFATGTQVFEHRCRSSAQPYYGQYPSWMHALRAQGHAVVAIGKQHYRAPTDDTGFSEQILPMYLANNVRGWPQGLLRRPLGEFPDAAHADIARALNAQLLQILDPEQVNRQAFADQAQKIEDLGGLEAIRNMPSFNHTPLEQG